MGWSCLIIGFKYVVRASLYETGNSNLDVQVNKDLLFSWIRILGIRQINRLYVLDVYYGGTAQSIRSNHAKVSDVR
jgi:hypothetical protein